MYPSNMDSDQDKSNFKLLIDNALMAAESRITLTFNDKIDKQTDKIQKTVSDQNIIFSGNILKMAADIAKLEEKVKIMNTKMVVLGTACASLGGFVGFFLAHILK